MLPTPWLFSLKAVPFETLHGVDGMKDLMPSRRLPAKTSRDEGKTQTFNTSEILKKTL